MNIENNFLNEPQLNVFDLQSLRRFTNSKVSNEVSLKQAAEQFEGIFIRQLLTSMRKVNDLFKEDNLFDSNTSDFYQEMWDDQIASSLSSAGNSNSISNLLLQELGGNQSTQSIANPTKMASNVDYQIKNPGVVASDNHPIRFTESIKPQSLQQSTSNTNDDIEPDFFESKLQFLEVLYPLAKAAAARIGGSAKALLAQAALETGWGKHIIKNDKNASSKNLFNIKDKADWNGRVTFKNAVEFDGEEFKVETSGFRMYQNFKQSFADFIDFISSRNRYQAVVEKASNPAQYFKQLQLSGYATDPDYATKIQHIFDSTVIQKFSE